MTPFLYRIAQAFYKKYGNEISRLAFVFPNRRSGIFSKIFGRSFRETDLLAQSNHDKRPNGRAIALYLNRPNQPTCNVV